jgi:hypothetical protein
VAVDPHDRDLVLQARLDVVVVRRRDVHPALLAADAARELLEVRGIGLVGAHLLGGHHELVVLVDVPARLAEQLVVDVRDEPGLELLDELQDVRVGLAEGRPAVHAVGQEAGREGSSAHPMRLAISTAVRRSTSAYSSYDRPRPRVRSRGTSG